MGQNTSFECVNNDDDMSWASDLIGGDLYIQYIREKRCPSNKERLRLLSAEEKKKCSMNQ